MNYKTIFIGILLVGSLGACRKKLDSLLVNPNNPDPGSADVDLYLNYVQLNFISFYNTASDYGGQLTRQQVMYGPLYSNAYSPNSFDGMWTTAYAEVIKNADALIPLAEEQKKYVQAGMARVLKAYVLATLVDDFGDVPFSEMGQGVSNTNPHVDGGADVYAGVLNMLDSAIVDLTTSGASAAPANDLFFASVSDEAASWVTLAKTLKLKLYMQERLVDNTAAAKVDGLISDGDLIDAGDASEDFEFKYGTNLSSPDARHPHYAADYTSTGSGDYIGTYFLWAVGYEKGFKADPRLRYYFYRQQTDYSAVSSETCPCAFNNRPSYYPAGMPYCLPYSTGGYWGRDHGDNTGIPPDGALRTAWGIYPAGGEFDDDQGAGVSLGMGAKGEGIAPIWLASFTDFLEAEAALTLGTSGDPRALLEKGIRTSIAKVVGYPATIGYSVDTTITPKQASIDSYVNLVLGSYDAASTDDERLNIIEKEYYIASWGNGIEPYNNYRRTGKPDNMQLTAYSSDPGYFIRSFLYPAVFENRNLNAPNQKTPGAANKVFWDSNADDFCK